MPSIVRGSRATEIRASWESAPVSHPDDDRDWTWSRLVFHTREMAEFHLIWLGRDIDTMSTLRRLLVPFQHNLSRLRDAQVVAAVASLLTQQRLVMYEGTQALQEIGVAGVVPVVDAPVPRGAAAARGSTPPPPSARASGTASSPPAAPVPRAEPGLEDGAQDEQAAALIAAARDGVPFCEVCEKARLAAQAPTPELEPA